MRGGTGDARATEPRRHSHRRSGERRRGAEQPFDVVARGYVEHGHGPTGDRYFLSSAVYRSLGNAIAYVRIHGAVQGAIEDQIVNFITVHGSIRRREVAELCHIDTDVAGRILAKMNREERIMLPGARRASYYVLPIGDH